MTFFTKRLLYFFLLFLLIVGSVLGGYYIRTYFFANELRQQERDQLKAYEDYLNGLQGNVDEQGGATPEETLRLLISALRQEDVQLASSYFLPDQNGSRERWVSYLQGVKDNGYMQLMAGDIEGRAEPAGTIEDGSFSYEILDEDGVVAVSILFRFNGRVWKVESI